jgi:hypothetical protein
VPYSIAGGKMYGKEKQGGRCKSVPDILKENRRHWKSKKQEELDHTPWKTCFESGYGPVTWQTK